MKKDLACLGWTGQELETKMGSLIGKWLAELADLLLPVGAILCSSFIGTTDVQYYG